MSIERLQQKIRQKKTPLALGLCPSAAHVPETILHRFTEAYGDQCRVLCESYRDWGCQLIDAAAERLPAVYLRTAPYLCCGAMGMDVLADLASAAHDSGLYVILDCRADPDAWLATVPAADAVAVLPYEGSDGLPTDEDKGAFALLRTVGSGSGQVQNLVGGDRRLYLAVGDQMDRRGAGAVIETGYSLDIREVRHRLEDVFLIVTNADYETASYAFDDYGRKALLVDEKIQYVENPAAAIDAAVKGLKQWITVL